MHLHDNDIVNTFQIYVDHQNEFQINAIHKTQINIFFVASFAL